MSGGASLARAGAPEAGETILTEVHRGVATATLNRPRAHNALSLAMIRRLADLLDAWESDDAVRVVELRGAGGNAFSAGGDLREVHRSITAGLGTHPDFFRLEYGLDYRIHTYPKPIVAVMDGIVMGGGMGIGQGARLRVVGPRTRMAMPETAIGLFPDVGGSHFLSRTPGRIGFYLGLTGAELVAADAIHAGLADEMLPGTTASGSESLARLQPAIDAHFAAPGVAAIVGSLEREKAPGFRDWAAKTAELLRTRSPTMLHVTHEALRRGATLGLADCFRMELNLVHACFAHPDMLEGIRARLIDKDNAPRWRPGRIEDVEPAAVAAFFAPRWEPEDHPLASLGGTG